jgi:hypothetical protein
VVLKTFGLDIQDVSFVDENGKQHTFSYQSKEKRGYKDLSEEEKQKVKNILFERVFNICFCTAILAYIYYNKDNTMLSNH